MILQMILKNKQQGYEKCFYQENLLQHLFLQWTFLEILKVFSEKFQESAATVIGKELLRANLLHEIDLLKTQNILQEARCIKNKK